MTQFISPYVYAGLYTAPQTILAVISKRLDIPVKDILGTCRNREFMDAAKIATFILRDKFPTLTLHQLGELLSDSKQLDHSTVIHRLKQHKELFLVDKVYKNKCKLCGIV